MQARCATLILCLGLGAGPVAAEDPLSAIEWLSDSVAAPDAPEAAALPEMTALPGDITVTPLAQPEAAAIGLLSPATSGLPRNLWGTTSAVDAATLVRAMPRDLPPSLERLFTILLLAEVDSPADPEDALLLARIDRLLDAGALDQAAALLDVAGLDTPDRFRRYFDIALLQGREKPACGILRDRPEIAPTYPSRIFCLARGGDWAAAALTLETATSLGILTPEEDLLLARFLDPEIFADGSVEAPPVTPLNFRLYEAIGEPFSTRSLPLAFAWSDLRPTRGWKAQLDAAERLARHGAISANHLFGLYLKQEPSASGGVWDRVDAVQEFDRAIANGDVAEISRTLVDTWAALDPAGLSHVFAEQYGLKLIGSDFSGPAAETALRVGLISENFVRAARAASPSTPRDRFLVALALGRPATAIAPDPLSEAVRAGFIAGEPPETEAQLLEAGLIGEAILRAISQFSDGAHGDLDGISGAIATLRALDLEVHARRAALDLLLADRLG